MATKTPNALGRREQVVLTFASENDGCFLLKASLRFHTDLWKIKKQVIVTTILPSSPAILCASMHFHKAPLRIQKKMRLPVGSQYTSRHMHTAIYSASFRCLASPPRGKDLERHLLRFLPLLQVAVARKQPPQRRG